MATMHDKAFFADKDLTILGQLYGQGNGAAFNEELCVLHGSRFGGSPQEQAAAVYLKDKFLEYGLDNAWLEGFETHYWRRKHTSLQVVVPTTGEEVDCIALPNCPPGEVEGELVYIGDGDPQSYADNADKIKGSIVMVSTANPAFFHRGMHRGEKLGRAVLAGAAGFIWMRGEGGGLPETGSARFGALAEIPVISISLEAGMALMRKSRQGKVILKITSDNDCVPVTSYNVIGEIKGSECPDEIIVVGGHYDGHDISEAAVDNGSGIAVTWEAARALAKLKGQLKRTIRFVGFAQEEMGLLGSDAYVKAHHDEKIVFMLNLDVAGGGMNGRFSLQGWSEDLAWLKQLFSSMGEGHIRIGDAMSTYSDMYHFAAAGFPAGSYASSNPSNNGGAPRGYGHTYWDTIDKINPRAIQLDSIMVARFLMRLALLDSLPFKKKEPIEMTKKLQERGYEEVMAYENRLLPHEVWPK